MVSNLAAGQQAGAAAAPAAQSVEYHDSVVASYKEMIRMQDSEIASLKKALAAAQQQLRDADAAAAQKTAAAVATAVAEATAAAAAATAATAAPARSRNSPAPDSPPVAEAGARAAPGGPPGQVAALTEQLAASADLCGAAWTPGGGGAGVLARAHCFCPSRLRRREDAFKELMAEHEDLLVCLAEEADRIKDYRARLRELHEEVSASEDEDEPVSDDGEEYADEEFADGAYDDAAAA
jgi:hypothetical protein